MSSSSFSLVSQNLAPIMPFIEPTQPIELPLIFEFQSSNQNQSSFKNHIHSNSKFNPIQSNHIQTQDSLDHESGNTSEEEAMLERTRMDLERKLGELAKLKKQLAQTEKRERELASRIVA
ncbi:hypothetical protein O181_071941 [Austropuccinia psidii MF-1]|uniref:Uncharacterized protein n=1 Tax=Austropuccinia psidii MF-1 TaxID=1389203 RepID=A0A9Q3I6Z0_9BASI|nr:hypothetical protein [Austropuccinia psidii MF-1]